MFNVDMSGETRQKIRTLFDKACKEHRGEQFLAAIKAIRHRLETDPHDFGEPLYHLPKLRMQVRKAIVVPLSIDYSVSLDHDNVVLKGIKLMDVH